MSRNRAISISIAVALGLGLLLVQLWVLSSRSPEVYAQELDGHSVYYLVRRVWPVWLGAKSWVAQSQVIITAPAAARLSVQPSGGSQLSFVSSM